MKDNNRGGARKNSGGARAGAGRKTDRAVFRGKPVYLFADQLPATSAEVRAALDEYRQKKANLVQ